VETTRSRATRRTLVGLALVALAWPLDWLLEGPRTHVLFFPLWLGYVLAVDGLVERRTGTSILARSRRDFAALFLVSVPAWWVFELLNRRVRNWEYVGREHFGDAEYALLCSVAFSTVLPAVFESAELVRSFSWIERFSARRRIRPSPRLLTGLFVTGVGMLALTLAWPRAFFPFVWVAGVLLLEPLCRLLGRPSLLSRLRHGDWRPWVSLWGGVLLCAFFWEMWNVRSYPKWVYHVPGVGFAKVFEMPLLGYLGYLPFALELWLLQQLLLPGGPRVRL
jgi:hypothetical protein